MHERGYQYTGESPITSLTRGEIDILQLGWITREEQKANNQSDDPNHSKKQTMKQASKNRAREQFKQKKGLA